MSWESRKLLIKTISIKDSIDYNVAEHLGAPGTPKFKYSKYVVEVHSSDTNELLYRVLMEPDGTWKHSKMFCDAWETHGVFNFEIFERRPSILICMDGNSAAENMIQEAKNGKGKSLICYWTKAKVLEKKAKSLSGYIHGFDEKYPIVDVLRDYQKIFNIL